MWRPGCSHCRDRTDQGPSGLATGPEPTPIVVLVQPMVSGLARALIAIASMLMWAPLVMVAAGGVLTEIYRDRSLRLAPIDLATAHEMIGEVLGLKPLAG